FHGARRDVDFAPPKLVVEGRLERTQGINIDDFDFLKSNTTRTPKNMHSVPQHGSFQGRAGCGR
ncbi:MAG: hypothetical protein QGF09_15985, partial [Rhodospirillales bacterium]|nr:hypothetical protein [Rhodospirillales bacterium]